MGPWAQWAHDVYVFCLLIKCFRPENVFSAGNKCFAKKILLFVTQNMCLFVPTLCCSCPPNVFLPLEFVFPIENTRSSGYPGRFLGQSLDRILLYASNEFCRRGQASGTPHIASQCLGSAYLRHTRWKTIKSMFKQLPNNVD